MLSGRFLGRLYIKLTTTFEKRAWKGGNRESKIFCKAYVREVQGHQKKG